MTSKKFAQGQSGFTLLEVMITIGILLSLTLAVTELLKAGIDLRARLSQSGKVTHRLAMAMDKIDRDLSHAFIIGKLEKLNRKSAVRPTLFYLKQVGDSVELKLTTRSHRPKITNVNESDLTFVVYRIEEDSDNPRHKNLYRGEASIIPANLKEDPKMRILARNIKKFKISVWNGERWLKDGWDSRRGDFRNLIPSMVKVELELGLVDFDPEGLEEPENVYYLNKLVKMVGAE
jgi:prepilin-type N-terminal cleavage/methylation domain-containing protein